MNIDKEKLEELLLDAEKAHGEYEKENGEADKNWPGWYAEYITKKLKEDG